MCSLLPSILWIHWQSIAYTHTCTQVQNSPSCLFMVSLVFSSVHSHLTSHHPILPSISAIFTSTCIASFPSLSSKSSMVFFSFLFFFVYTPRGSETGARVWLQLLIKNQYWPVCHEVRNLSGPLCGRCTDPYEDILYCQHWNKKKNRLKIHSSTAFS